MNSVKCQDAVHRTLRKLNRVKRDKFIDFQKTAHILSAHIKYNQSKKLFVFHK